MKSGFHDKILRVLAPVSTIKLSGYEFVKIRLTACFLFILEPFHHSLAVLLFFIHLIIVPHHESPDGMSDAAFIVAQGNIISLVFHMFIGVAHNHANLGEL